MTQKGWPGEELLCSTISDNTIGDFLRNHIASRSGNAQAPFKTHLETRATSWQVMETSEWFWCPTRFMFKGNNPYTSRALALP